MIRLNGVNYPYNLYNNITEINEVSYNILWEDQHLIIIDSNRYRMNTPPPTGKLAKIAITGYFACFMREKGVEQIYFPLV